MRIIRVHTADGREPLDSPNDDGSTRVLAGDRAEVENDAIGVLEHSVRSAGANEQARSR
ncbi:MAG: hypothetical protein GVY22_16480 [Gammaproteobacteria bacterium]|jgi:hypothetical protein|nr:hypothetical protein [Gammaproteobacteria bacterium]